MDIDIPYPAIDRLYYLADHLYCTKIYQARYQLVAGFKFRYADSLWHKHLYPPLAFDQVGRAYLMITALLGTPGPNLTAFCTLLTLVAVTVIPEVLGPSAAMNTVAAPSNPALTILILRELFKV